MLGGMRIKGMRQLSQKLRRLVREVTREERKAFADIARDVQNVAKKRAPTDRGQLRHSINSKVHASRHIVWSEVGSNLKQARFTELGNAPRGGGKIRARGSKPMIFQVRTRGGRRWRRAHVVTPFTVGTARNPRRRWKALAARGGSGQTAPWLRRAAYICHARAMRRIKAAGIRGIRSAARR